MNKKVAMFQYKHRRYEVDMLTDTKWGSETYYFDIFDVTNSSYCVGQFESHEGADYKKLAKEVIVSQKGTSKHKVGA